MNNRVVITGLGVAAPNGIGIPAFNSAIKTGVSGIRFIPELETLKFNSQIAGIPPLTERIKEKYFTPLEIKKLSGSGIFYTVIAGMEAWRDAGLSISPEDEPDWNSGIIFGSASTPTDVLTEKFPLINAGKTRRLGGYYGVQVLPGRFSAGLNNKIGLGNKVSTNSSACATGTESIHIAYEHLKHGKAKRMLAGGAGDRAPHFWAAFDTIHLTTNKYNKAPEKGSRPMAEDASGLVAGSGAGALVLETLDSAIERGVHIYGEIIGGHVNSGGQRQGGSMTMFNNIGTQKCIEAALKDAQIDSSEIDLINGHLTSTGMDELEIKNWAKALNRSGSNFPYITALKSMIGHCLGAAGAIESVAAILQLDEGFLVPNLNCEHPDPKILEIVDRQKITQQLEEKRDLEVIIKASFGFGDVNSCVVFKKYESN